MPGVSEKRLKKRRREKDKCAKSALGVPGQEEGHSIRRISKDLKTAYSTIRDCAADARPRTEGQVQRSQGAKSQAPPPDHVPCGAGSTRKNVETGSSGHGNRDDRKEFGVTSGRARLQVCQDRVLLEKGRYPVQVSQREAGGVLRGARVPEARGRHGRLCRGSRPRSKGPRTPPRVEADRGAEQVRASFSRESVRKARCPKTSCE